MMVTAMQTKCYQQEHGGCVENQGCTSGLIDCFFFWDDNHCEECYKIELERQQLPPEYRLPLAMIPTEYKP